MLETHRIECLCVRIDPLQAASVESSSFSIVWPRFSCLKPFTKFVLDSHVAMIDLFIRSERVENENLSRAPHTHEINENLNFLGDIHRRTKNYWKISFKFSFSIRSLFREEEIFSFPLQLSACNENSFVACIIHFLNEIFIQYRVNTSCRIPCNSTRC